MGQWARCRTKRITENIPILFFKRTLYHSAKQTYGNRMYINNAIMCRVWDNVQYPIGTTQITIKPCDDWNKYLDLIYALNKNGYIVYGTTHTNSHSEENIATYIKEKYGLPLFLIANEHKSDEIQSIMKNSDIFNGVISVAETSGSHSPIHLIKKLTFGQTLDLSEHVPILIINSVNNFRNNNRHFARNLHNVYKNYNPEKLTVILYSDTHDKSLISTEKEDIKKEILSFLRTIQNKK